MLLGVLGLLAFLFGCLLLFLAARFVVSAPLGTDVRLLVVGTAVLVVAGFAFVVPGLMFICLAVSEWI